MKNSIEGFNQAYAMTLKKEVERNGKLVTRKVDCTDLVILRWLVDFYPKMRTMNVDGERYVMLTFGKLQKDLPLLDISKRALSERLQKLVDFKILKYKFIKDGGTFSLFAFGENYINLVRSTDEGVCVQPTTGYAIDQQRGMRSTDNGVCVQPTTKDNSIIDNSIINKKENNIKEIIDYLNEKALTAYKYQSANTQRHIKARLSEGFTVDDFKKVIDHKVEEWGNTDFAQYLRPETLFGTKFESYLNAGSKKKERSIKEIMKMDASDMTEEEKARLKKYYKDNGFGEILL